MYHPVKRSSTHKGIKAEFGQEGFCTVLYLKLHIFFLEKFIKAIKLYFGNRLHPFKGKLLKDQNIVKAVQKFRAEVRSNSRHNACIHLLDLFLCLGRLNTLRTQI